MPSFPSPSHTQVDDDARNASSGNRSIDTHRQGSLSLGEDVQRQLEEAELAAAVQVGVNWGSGSHIFKVT